MHVPQSWPLLAACLSLAHSFTAVPNWQSGGPVDHCAQMCGEGGCDCSNNCENLKDAVGGCSNDYEECKTWECGYTLDADVLDLTPCYECSTLQRSACAEAFDPAGGAICHWYSSGICSADISTACCGGNCCDALRSPYECAARTSIWGCAWEGTRCSDTRVCAPWCVHSLSSATR